ncbi:glutamine synthetase/guanido kinase [Atractiella rhizophila]|nr:glutamine synthetase/guanido kinase [Atractiella rhizophila]
MTVQRQQIQPRHDLLQSFLSAHPSIQFIRYNWVSPSGLLYCRNVTVQHALFLCSSGKALKIGPIAHILRPSKADVCFEKDIPIVGIDYLYPDFESLRIIPWTKNADGKLTEAWVWCDVFEEDRWDFERCGRKVLEKVLSTAKEQDITFQLGFEVEFTLFTKEADGELKKLDNVGGAFNPSAYRRPEVLSYLQEVSIALLEAGIQVYQFHSEGGQALFEISTGPLSPIQSVDALYFTRECIQAIAMKYGWIATSYPHSSVGLHHHLSIEGPKGKGEDQQRFLEGVLDKMTALCAFSMPTVDSYKRVFEFSANMGAYIGYGTENRETPVRKIRDGYWEYRNADSTANSYLAVAFSHSRRTRWDRGRWLFEVFRLSTLDSSDF